MKRDFCGQDFGTGKATNAASADGHTCISCMNTQEHLGTHVGRTRNVHDPCLKWYSLHAKSDHWSSRVPVQRQCRSGTSVRWPLSEWRWQYHFHMGCHWLDQWPLKWRQTCETTWKMARQEDAYFIQVIHIQGHQDGPKDFLCIALHVGLRMEHTNIKEDILKSQQKTLQYLYTAVSQLLAKHWRISRANKGRVEHSF